MRVTLELLALRNALEKRADMQDYFRELGEDNQDVIKAIADPNTSLLQKLMLITPTTREAIISEEALNKQIKRNKHNFVVTHKDLMM